MLGVVKRHLRFFKIDIFGGLGNRSSAHIELTELESRSLRFFPPQK